MASLEHTLYRFQNGDLTQNELLSQVDDLLAVDQANSAKLKEILNKERTKTFLPPYVYAELQNRIDVPIPPNRNVVEGQKDIDPGSHTGSTRSFPHGANAFNESNTDEPGRMKDVGDTLNNRFVLEECIGFGGMSIVYKALDLRKLEASDRNPYIAIKVLNVQFQRHPKSLIALQREAKKAQTLAHPNIVTVYDFDRDGPTVYLTMEYLQGNPLSHLLRSPGFTGMPYPEVMRIVSGMAKALAYAHERGFVHSDFKPGNVILTDKGEIKVIDFGIARAFHKPTDEVEATVFDPGSLGGLTPAYASPEMLERREPDPRDDIYALGCITYELLTGHHPFDRQTAVQARNAGMKPQRPANLGFAQWRELKRALAFNREARTPTVMEFLQGMKMERKGANTVAVAASAAFAMLIVATGGFYLLFQNTREGDQRIAVESAGGAPSPAAEAEAPATEMESPIAKVEPPAPETGQHASEVEQPAPRPALLPAKIEQIVKNVPCAALIHRIQNDKVQVEGFLPGSFGAEKLKEQLGNTPGVAEVSMDVQQVGDDKCNIVNLFAPYWKQNRRAEGSAAVHTRSRNARLTEGDKLILDVNTPGYESYVNVDYYSFDGNVLHLLPSRRARANLAPPNYSATIGGAGDWVVSKPFGTDLIVLLITPAPLFEGVRPDLERSPEYLRAVDERLKQMEGKSGAGKIVVEFLQIITGPRK